MNKWMLAALLSLLAAIATAEERHFVCVSDTDGTEYRLIKSDESGKGRLTTTEMTGEAQVFPGLGNLTFMYVDDQNVITFFIKDADLKYNLSIRKPHFASDRGQCQEVPV